MRRKKILMLMLVSIFTLTTVLGFSKDWKKGKGKNYKRFGKREMRRYPGRRSPFMMMNMIKKLKLSDAQMEKFNDVQIEYKKKKIEIDSKLKIAYITIKQLTTKKEIDMEKVQQVAEEIGKLHTQKVISKVKKISEIKNLLNAEQLKKLKKWGLLRDFLKSFKRKKGHPSRHRFMGKRFHNKRGFMGKGFPFRKDFRGRKGFDRRCPRERRFEYRKDDKKSPAPNPDEN